MTRTSWLTMAAIAVASNASAQQSASDPPVRYVSAGGVLSWQSQGQSDCPYLCGPFGGVTFGPIVATGGQVTPTLTVGVEVSSAGVLSGTQSRRLALVPSARFHYLFYRDGDPPKLGVGNLLARFGFSAEIRF